MNEGSNGARSNTRAKVILAAVVTALCLGAGEAVLRMTSDPAEGYGDILEQREQARQHSLYQAHADPEILYELRSSYGNLTNSAGTIGTEEVTLEKPAGTSRVVVLGDSISAGVGIRTSGGVPWVDDLRRLLRESAGLEQNIEVLNFGTDGYSTRQEARLLEVKAGAYDPDLLIVQFCPNDPAQSYTPAAWFVDYSPPASYLLNRLLHVLGLRPTTSEIDPSHTRYAPPREVMWSRSYADSSEQWAGVLDAFARIESYADRKWIPVVLVMFPLLLDEGFDFDGLMGRVQTRVREAGERHGFLVVDLADTFFDEKVVDLREMPGDFYHVDAAAHHQAAEAVQRLILDRGLLFAGPAGAQPGP